MQPNRCTKNCSHDSLLQAGDLYYYLQLTNVCVVADEVLIIDRQLSVLFQKTSSIWSQTTALDAWSFDSLA